jgi:OOP family OmpA-OmpF porin
LAKAEEVKKIEEKLLKEEKFVVESIHFAFDKDQIESEFENTLDSLAEVLRLHPEWKIRIEGHTDSLGTEAYNKDLSQRRANAVKAYLLKTGVNSTQLVDAVGLGLSEPVADNGTPEGRYKNRRVEFKLEK